MQEVKSKGRIIATGVFRISRQRHVNSRGLARRRDSVEEKPGSGSPWVDVIEARGRKVVK